MSNTQNWPGELPGDNPASPWVNKLRAAAMASCLADVKFPGGQAKLIPGAQGQTLVLSANPAQVPNIPQPFQIYSINNLADPTLSTFTFQIRSGTVGVRSAYPVSISGQQIPQNNYELLMSVTTDGGTALGLNPGPATGGNVALPNVGDTKIWDSLSIPPFKQIVINSDIDGLVESNASFWIVITDDITNGIGWQLWGRMFTLNGSDPTGRTTQVFPPANPNQIILGTVTITGDLPGATIAQFQLGNLVNRYAPAVLVSQGSSAGAMRGKWSVIIAATPTGQVFWSGDRVINDSVILYTIGGNNFYGVYSYITTPAAIAVAPSPGASWILDGLIII